MPAEQKSELAFLPLQADRSERPGVPGLTDYYLFRGADDDMRKEDCISSESRLILGPVVEISNLKFFDNLLKNFITKGWRSPHMSEQGKTICH